MTEKAERAFIATGKSGNRKRKRLSCVGGSSKSFWLHRRNYGYRRVKRDLKDQGWVVNHKRVARIMAEDNLLSVREAAIYPGPRRVRPICRCFAIWQRPWN